MRVSYELSGETTPQHFAGSRPRGASIRRMLNLLAAIRIAPRVSGSRDWAFGERPDLARLHGW
jgi:hypothetical protein